MEDIMRALYPYASKYGTVKTFPEEGISKAEIIEQINWMSE